MMPEMPSTWPESLKEYAWSAVVVLFVTFAFIAAVAVLTLLFVFVYIYRHEGSWAGVASRLKKHKRGNIFLNLLVEIRSLTRKYDLEWERAETGLLCFIFLLQYLEIHHFSEYLHNAVAGFTLAILLIKIGSRKAIGFFIQLREHTGAGKLKKDVLLRAIQKPLESQHVHLAEFEDDEKFGREDSVIRSYSAVLDLIIDREEAEVPFTPDDRAELYRRWLYSGQPVLAAYLDEQTGKPLCASVVLPLTKHAYERYRVGTLDAIKIEPWDIEGISGGQEQDNSQKYLLIDALAVNKGVSPGLGVRLALYHCLKFSNACNPPVVLFSSIYRRFIERFSDYKFKISEKKWHDGSYIFYAERDLWLINPEDPALDEFQNIAFALMKIYNAPSQQRDELMAASSGKDMSQYLGQDLGQNLGKDLGQDLGQDLPR